MQITKNLTPAKQRAVLAFDRATKNGGSIRIGNGSNGSIHHKQATWLVQMGAACIKEIKDVKHLSKKAAPNTKAKVAPVKAKKANDKGNPCMCGCGGKVYGKRVFLQGHDAKLKSQLLKQVKGKGKLPANHPCSPDMQAVYTDRWNLNKVK